MPFYTNENLHLESVENEGICTSLTVVTPGVIKIKGSGRVTSDYYDLNTNSITVPESADLYIYADTITIAGRIHIPGRNVLIIARVLESLTDQGSPAQIDVSGTSGEAIVPTSADPWTSRADDAPAQTVEMKPGANGTNGSEGHWGANGNPGHPAGTINISCREHIASGKLILRAIGGDGGTGQNGGRGQDGGNGGKGGNRTVKNAFQGPAANGGTAGAGGPGGPGGNAGVPGAAGRVEFCCVIAEPTAVKFEAFSGNRGKPGNGGPGGTAGLPGLGGDLHCEPDWSPVIYHEGPHTLVNNGLPGLPANAGDQGNLGGYPEVEAHQAGPTYYFPLSARYFAHTLNADFCQQMYNRAACLYLGVSSPQEGLQLLTQASEILRFLNECLILAVQNIDDAKKVTPPNLHEFLNRAYRGLSMRPRAERDKLRAIGLACATLLNRMSLRLDYFGHPYDHVPGLSLKYYEDRFKEAHQTLAETEESYGHIFKDFGKNADKRIAMERARNVKLPALAAMDKQLEIIRTHLEQDLQTIYHLIAPADRARDAAEQAIESFRTEMTKFELNFGQLLATMESLSFMPEHGETQALMGGSQFGKLLQSFGQVETSDGRLVNRDYVIAQIDTLAEDFSNVRDVYAMTQHYYDIKDPNGYKMQALQSKIEYLIDQFLTRTAAKDVHKAVQNYVNAVTARNGAMLAYNAHLQQYYEKVAERDKNQQELAAIESQLATSSAIEWSLTGIKTYIDTQLQSVREYCLELLCKMQRTLAYATVQPCPNIFKLANVDKLYAVNKDVINDVYKELNSLLDGAYENKDLKLESFEADKELPTFSFTHSEHPELIETLRNTGSVTFEIPPILPSRPAAGLTNAANVRVYTIRVILSGANFPRNQHELTLTPFGAESIVDRHGNVRQYSHLWDPVQLSFILDPRKRMPEHFERDGQLYDPDDMDKYIANGAFCHWNLFVRRKADPDREKILEHVNAIHIYLYGKATTLKDTSTSDPKPMAANAALL